VGASFDLDVGVERRGELSVWLPRDPLRRLADLLVERGVTDLGWREQVIASRINSAVEAARSAARPEASRVNQYVWQESACAR
jgi:TPP-dependent pyruvate/acetoin dehydrogenase alpha subunit